MRRTRHGREIARLAAGPLATVHTITIEGESAPSFRPVLMSPAPSHSGIGAHTSDGLRAVDVGLDYYDANNELPDGTLAA